MRIIYFVLYSLAMTCCTCGDNRQKDDASTHDTSAPQSMDAQVVSDAAQPQDALTRPDAGVLPLCSEACPGVPGVEWAPWYVDGVYWWSYCLPTYERCIDPAQCGSACPPSD